MFTIQPPFIREYFAAMPKDNQSTSYRRMFLSWEDGLWHLLKVYKVKAGATVLLPEFYCGDVANHMMEHGLKVVYYPVDRLLVTSTNKFVEMTLRYKPQIVVIFHAVGITNPLMSEAAKWQSTLSPTCLIVEDCVHRLIEDDHITFVSDRHFLIDSLRKVVPIQGSNLYSRVWLPCINWLQMLLTLPYRAQVLYYWIRMQIWLLRAYNAKHEESAIVANIKADVVMVKGYDLIGSNRLASPGIRLMDYLYKRVPIKRIERDKERQVKMYARLLKPLLRFGDFWLPTMKESDYKYLRGFPVIMSLKVAEATLACLRRAGIMVRFELNDGPWSQKQKIVYLPMGLHVSDIEMENILDTHIHK